MPPTAFPIEQSRDYFYLGISAHHMLVSNGDDYVNYRNVLQNDVKPVLDRLLNSSIPQRPKVIWLNQFPTVDFWVENGANNAEIYAGKIHRYNLILRGVLR